MRLPRVLKDLLSLPTAPFREAAVFEYLQRACRRLEGVRTRFDRHGNFLAHYRRSPGRRPALAFVAHTDHPGFVAEEMLGRQAVRATFRGGVRPEFFAGAKVRFWTGGRWVRGRVVKLTRVGRIRDAVGWVVRPEEALVEVAGPVEPGAPGMWDLPEPALKGDMVTARGCDDLAGVAGMVTLLQRLARGRQPANVYCLFARAEEVGFIGAIAAARAGTLPRGAAVLSIETSSALPNAPVGEGPILRVGDKAAVFDPRLIAFADRVARQLAARRRGFAYQRKLMDGGTCEAVPFLSHGYVAAGICLALGNYHNMDRRRGRIASEFISLRDWQRMVDFFEALVLDEQGWKRGDPGLRERLDERFKRYGPLLGGR